MNRSMQMMKNHSLVTDDTIDEEDTGECWKITNLSQHYTPHFCRSCMLGFRDRILLNSHLKLHYIGNQDITETTVLTKDPEQSTHQVYRCLNCKEQFHNPSQLKIHGETCRNEVISWQCDICEDVFEDKDLLHAHFADMHTEHVLQDTPIECPECQLVFDNSEDLKIHIDIDHEPETPPKKYRNRDKQDVFITVGCECGKVFMSEQDYQEHMMEEHPGLQPIKWPKDISEIKKRRRRSSNTPHTHTQPRKRHMPGAGEYTHSPKGRGVGRPPKHERMAFHQTPLYREPMSNDPGGTCVECGETFSKIVELKRHTQTIHQHLKPYACSLCARRFTRKSDVKRHIETIHGQAVSQEDLDRIQAIRPFRCAKCGNPFGRYSDIRKHIEVHHGLPFSPDTYIYQLEHMNDAGLSIGTSGEQVTIRTYDCGLCKRKYRNKTTVRHHIRKDHVQEDPDQFISRSNLAHSEDLECQFCGDGFSCVEEKMEHVQTIHQMAEECGDMVEDVRLASVLEQDIMRSGEDDDDECLMPVKDVSTPEKQQQRAQTKHTASSNQIVILKQEVINSSPHPSNVQHPAPLEVHHDKKDNSWCQSLMYDIVSENTTILKEKADYDCPECSRSFTRPKSLQAHIQKMHSRKLLEFECEICGKSYKQQAQFVKHLQIAHPEVGPKTPGAKGKHDKEKDHVHHEHMDKVYRRDQLDTDTHTHRHADTHPKQDTKENPGSMGVAVSADAPLMEYYTCSLCSAMFSSTESLQRHMNVKHKDVLYDNRQTGRHKDSSNMPIYGKYSVNKRKSVLALDPDEDVNLDKTGGSMDNSVSHDVSVEYT